MKLRFRTKLSYGIGGVADNAMYTMAGTFLLFFLTSVAGIRPAAAGTIVACGSVWEVLCGPVTGFLSDHTISRMGKRKPFLLAAAFPVALTTSLLFTAIDAPYTLRVIYYFVLTLLFWQAFAMFFVPYMAWGADLTEDYHERTVLRSYAYVFNQFGMALGMVLPMWFVDLMMNMGRSREVSWTMTGIFVGACSAAALLYCALTIHETDDSDCVKEKGAGLRDALGQLGQMFREYADILRLRPVRCIIGASLLYLIANTLFSSDRIYYFTYNQGLSSGQISLILLLITVSGVAMAPAVAVFSGWSDKKQVLLTGIGGTGLFLMLARFLWPDSFAGSCLLCLIYSVGNTCYWQLMPSMLYDVCEADELASGRRRAGQVISLQALSESLSTAFAAQILGIVLELAGFDESAAVQSTGAMTWISHNFTLVPGICMVLVAVIIFIHPIDKTGFARIREALARREKGEAVDPEEYRDLLG